MKSTIWIHVQLGGSKQMKLIIIFFQALCRLELMNTKYYCKKYTVVPTSTLDSFFQDTNKLLVASEKLTATVIFTVPEV